MTKQKFSQKCHGNLVIFDVLILRMHEWVQVIISDVLIVGCYARMGTGHYLICLNCITSLIL